MPTYSFQPRFIDPIDTGKKGGTIRAERRHPPRWADATRIRYPGGHASAGMQLALWCKLRTPYRRLIGYRTCAAAEPITLRLDAPLAAVYLHSSGLVLTMPPMLDAFAVFDGFEDWPDLSRFWAEAHRYVSIFNGWHIRWLDLPPALRVAP